MQWQLYGTWKVFFLTALLQDQPVNLSGPVVDTAITTEAGDDILLEDGVTELIIEA